MVAIADAVKMISHKAKHAHTYIHRISWKYQSSPYLVCTRQRKKENTKNYTSLRISNVIPRLIICFVSEHEESCDWIQSNPNQHNEYDWKTKRWKAISESTTWFQKYLLIELPQTISLQKLSRSNLSMENGEKFENTLDSMAVNVNLVTIQSNQGCYNSAYSVNSNPQSTIQNVQIKIQL